MSDVFRHTDKPRSGTTSVTIDGVRHEGVTYMLSDNLASVMLSRAGGVIEGKSGTWAHCEEEYSIEHIGRGLWKVPFIA